jgi:RNA polymerase sigma factor (sigma-70 family)
MARPNFYATFVEHIRTLSMNGKNIVASGRLGRTLTNQQDILDISGIDSMSDEQDFIILMRQNQERVYRLAFHLLGNVEEAKDATQEAFIKAWKKLDTLRWETCQAWLSKITVNLCLDWLRRRKFRGDLPEQKDETQSNLNHQLPDTNPNPLEECLSEEMQGRVREAISRLRPPYRAVVILRDLEGLSYKEIAEMLNVEISKVKSNLFRGRRELKEILRPFIEVSR